jgi:hypothetical protein
MGQDGETNIQIIKLTLTVIVYYKADRTGMMMMMMMKMIII